MFISAACVRSVLLMGILLLSPIAIAYRSRVSPVAFPYWSWHGSPLLLSQLLSSTAQGYPLLGYLQLLIAKGFLYYYPLLVIVEGIPCCFPLLVMVKVFLLLSSIGFGRGCSYRYPLLVMVKGFPIAILYLSWSRVSLLLSSIGCGRGCSYRYPQEQSFSRLGQQYSLRGFVETIGLVMLPVDS